MKNQLKPRGGLRGGFRFMGLAALSCVLLLLALWATAALYFAVRLPWLRGPLAAVFGCSILAPWILVKGLWREAALTVTGFGLVLGWWLMLQPSNNREWQPDLAVLPYADIEGSKITLRNIRNCDYRTETVFDVHYYDRQWDLDKLRTVDLFMVYWGSPYMAHAMVSFGFDGGEYVCFSIETRKEKGESYSALKGLFRQFEITYILSDERDVVRLRTNYRKGEEAYVYRLNATPERVRKFFLDYLRRVNSLREKPEWYNAVTDNCSTAIRLQQAREDRAPLNWRMLVNGYGDTLLYERGMIATNLPFAELKERSHINARAREADKSADFSRQIRQSLPGMSL